MTTTLTVGTRVETKLGAATILALENGKARIRLETLGIEVTIETADLRVIEDVKSKPGAPRPTRRSVRKRRPRPSNTRQVKLRTVEALRFGLVPTFAIERMTIRYTKLERWVESRLPDPDDPRPLISEVLGPFGTGKSHTMAAIRDIARNRNFLTAHVEVDGNHVSLSDPERLLYGLWSNLEGPDLDSTSPLLDLYARAIEEHGHPPRVSGGDIDRIGDNYNTVAYLVENDVLDEHGHLMDAILSSSNEVTANEANREIYPKRDLSDVWNGRLVRRLIGKRVVNRPFDFMEAMVGHTLVARQAGYSGIVVTIDEFEVEYGLSSDKFERIQRLLEVLSRYLQNKLNLPAAPISFFIASVPALTRSRYPELDEMLVGADADAYRLKPLSPSNLRELGKRIHNVYAEAYGIDDPLDEALADQVLGALDKTNMDDSGQTRAFVKRYVAALDSRYGPGPESRDH